MIFKLDCSCWVNCGCEDGCVCSDQCHCAEKSAAEHAAILLKLTNIYAEVGYNYAGKYFYCIIEPYEVSVRRRVQTKQLRFIRYSSIKSLNNGVARIMERRRQDSQYLALEFENKELGIFVRNTANGRRVRCVSLRPEYRRKR